MIGKSGIISSKDFKVGLFTRSDIVQSNPDFSPNCMDIKWYFDDAIGKRFGSSTANSTALSPTVAGATGTFIVQNSLTNNLLAYWKLDEASGTRDDALGPNNLAPVNNPLSVTGIRNNAALCVRADSSFLSLQSQNLVNAVGNYTFSKWVYLNSTAGSVTQLLFIGSGGSNGDFYTERFVSTNTMQLSYYLQGVGQQTLSATSIGGLNTGTFYNVISWVSDNHHVGIQVNLSINTALIIGSSIFVTTAGGGYLSLGGRVNTDTSNANIESIVNGRVDEFGIWGRYLTDTERANLYAGGSGNTYTPASTTAGSDPWYSFDFGASTTRWLTVCVGTGIFASSNAGASFVSIATTRTATYQYLDRSRNVLIATSDAYDQTLYWAGSAGTFFVPLAINSAPRAKFSINYQGFCILLNYMNSNGVISNRGFAYADENTQLADPWLDSFDLPSESADETTAPFILNKFLYVSTKYKIFRLNYAGGNPDWSYIQVANFGFVPRTVKVFNVKDSQYAVGLDWSGKIRSFNGYNGEIISDNIENFNDYCEFAMDRLSLAGSGLLVSNAEFDPNEQEYRLNVALGPQSTQTTTAIVLNARTLAWYPYSNQVYNTTCVAESGGKQFLMAFDRSGFCHILNSGNLDANTIPINETYDSPILFNKTPSEVSKNKQINFFFTHESAGTIYFQDRYDFSNTYSTMKPLRNHLGNEQLTGTESSILISRSVDLPSVQNVYQYRLTSSAGTATPWKLVHFDLLNTPLGYGRGK